jgi:hypothetical protein
MNVAVPTGLMSSAKIHSEEGELVHVRRMAFRRGREMTPPIEFQVLFYCLTILLIAMTGYQIHIWRMEKMIKCQNH